MTPLRASRALALRYLAFHHRVQLANLVLVSVAREAPAGEPARFATSDAEDLLGGVQRAFVLPPAPAAAGVVRPAGGFPVDLALHAHDGRVQRVETDA